MDNGILTAETTEITIVEEKF